MVRVVGPNFGAPTVRRPTVLLSRRCGPRGCDRVRVKDPLPHVGGNGRSQGCEEEGVRVRKVLPGAVGDLMRRRRKCNPAPSDTCGMYVAM